MSPENPQQEQDRTLGPLLIGLSGLEIRGEESEWLGHPAVGGVVLFTRNYRDVAQLTDLTNSIVETAGRDLLICVDHEGGRVQRFREGFTRLPPLALLGKMYADSPSNAKDFAYRHGRVMATELLLCGVDLSFAPVLDIGARSVVIGDRAFDADAAIIIKLSAAYIAGMHDAGMSATGKHFPGHGGVLEDSHLCLPKDSRCFQDLEDTDIVPYKELMKHGLDALMSAHVLFNHIDILPSGFSSFWIKDILRKKLGFQGVVFTDDLSMLGAIEYGDIIDRTRLALEAGCDIALICNDRSAVEKVLDNTGLQALINHEKDLSICCRRQAQVGTWEPQANQIDTLLGNLEAV